MSLLEGLKNHMGMECLAMKGLKLVQAVWILYRKCMFAVPLVPGLIETRPSCTDFGNEEFCRVICKDPSLRSG